MAEIYTYANPLTMNKDQLIWDMVKQYPQFCASDTLVQGMIEHFGRDQYTIIRPMSDLQKLLVGDVTNNVRFDMQLYLDVSHHVRDSKFDEDIKNSFRNNLGEITNAIRYLLFLNADPKKLLSIKSASSEQEELFKIYESVFENYKDVIAEAVNKDINDVQDAIKNALRFEVDYLLKNQNVRCTSLSMAKENLCIAREALIKEISKREANDKENTASKKIRLARIEYIVDLISKIESVNVETIIVHGVHKFTPELLLTIKTLENAGINIIYLIHYVEQLPQIYKTWKEVYSWMELDFKNVKNFDIHTGSKTGREIAKVLAGGLSTKKLTSLKTAYDNISSFAVGEVRPVFQQAQETLSKMKVQFYAVNNTDTNEILKNYFPEQFEVKPFLSYPIGQFVLGIYNMWDFDSSHMKLVPFSLRECVVSGMFENEVGGDISEIFDDIIPYIEGIDNMEDVLDRLVHLKSERAFIDRNPGLSDMKAICYFSRSESEIDRFIKYLKILYEVSTKIFAHDKDQIEYSAHFKNMMEILSVPLSNVSITHRTEVELAKSILASLSGYSDIVGDYYDLREALTFYLHQNQMDDSSNWIVRNFEQLDGAVLLADHTIAREYHFALLSMKNMTKLVSEELPWPLTEDIFYGYDCELGSSMHACAISNRERANFLKYSLFYGTFFFKNRITFSYVLNQNNEKQRAYYLLDLLKLKDLKTKENEDIHFGNHSAAIHSRSFEYGCLTTEQKEMFAICRYKYFLYRVLDEKIKYSNDFQIRYFLTNFITQIVLDHKKLTLQNMEAWANKYIQRFSAMFPNYDAVIFEDIKKNVKTDVEKALKNYKRNPFFGYSQNEQYKRRKKNFLLAKWDDSMNFEDVSPQAVLDYMINDDLLLSVENRPHVKVCENCNYYADCLMKYYEGVRFKENEV